MNSTLLDYAPLTEPVTRADMQAYKAAEATQSSSRAADLTQTIALGATLLVIVFIATIMISIFTRSTSGGSLVGSIVNPLVVIGACVIFFVVLRKQKMKLARLYKFAARNHLTFLHDIPNPNYAGMIFNEGHACVLKESLIFPGAIEIGNYEYTTGSGKSRETHNWGYVRIKLVRRLPNMVLDARSNNLFGVMSNLPDSFSRGQKVELEGDFNKYFTLYAPKEYKTDAFYVFTPDVMSAVIDSGKNYDMEVVDDNLILYSGHNFSLTSAEELKSLLVIAEKIGDEIRSQSDYYADDRVANRAENVVAEPGRRLKTGLSWVVIAIIVLVVLYNVLRIISGFRSNF